MSRDGLLPSFFIQINIRTKTPVKTIFFAGVIIALIAGFTPIYNVAELVNIGTLAAFVLVCSVVIMLRYKQPDLPRPFKTPYSPLIPLLGIIFCTYLMLYLTVRTWLAFLSWTTIGLVIYFTYSRNHSALNIE